MRPAAWRLRATALVCGGVVAVHQLRYLLAYGNGSHGALRAQGHAYLALLIPVIIIALSLCAASIVVALLRADRCGCAASSSERATWWRLWVQSAAAVLVLFVIQESVEGLLESRHPGGVAAIAAHGGWIAVPLAAFLGLVISLLLGGASAAVARVAWRLRRRVRRRVRSQERLGYRQPPPSLDRFARFLVGRGPPVTRW